MNFRFKETNRIKREAEEKKKKKERKEKKKKNEEEIIKHEKKKKKKIYISHSFFLRTKNTIFSPPEQGYTICYFCSSSTKEILQRDVYLFLAALTRIHSGNFPPSLAPERNNQRNQTEKCMIPKLEK